MADAGLADLAASDVADIEAVVAGVAEGEGSESKDKGNGKGKEKGKRKEKPKRARPDHFFALKISSPFILKWMSEMQDKIVEMAPDMAKSRIKTEKMHFTLFVFALKSENLSKIGSLVENEVLHLAKKWYPQSNPSCENLLKEKGKEDMSISISDEVTEAVTVAEVETEQEKEDHGRRPFFKLGKVGQFSSCRVVWVGPCDDEDSDKEVEKLKGMASDLVSLFDEHSLLDGYDGKKFNPHCTLFKARFGGGGGRGKGKGKWKKKGKEGEGEEEKVENENSRITIAQLDELNEKIAQDFSLSRDISNDQNDGKYVGPFTCVFPSFELVKMGGADDDGYYQRLYRISF